MNNSRTTALTRGFTFRALVILTAAGCLSAVDASAAVLNGSVALEVPGDQNLTALGTTDWTIYNYTGASGMGTTVGSTNSKSGGAGIGDVTVTVGQARGLVEVQEPASFAISYSDGVSPAAESGIDPRGVGSTSLNTVGAGFEFDVAGTAGLTNTAYVYVTGFNGTGTMTATLNGATVYSDSSETYANEKTATLYTFEFTPDSAGDLLNIEYILSNDPDGGNGSSHVELVAVALQQGVLSIPEPSTLALLGFGTLALFGRRRRRR